MKSCMHLRVKLQLEKPSFGHLIRTVWAQLKCEGKQTYLKTCMYLVQSNCKKNKKKFATFNLQKMYVTVVKSHISKTKRSRIFRHIYKVLKLKFCTVQFTLKSNLHNSRLHWGLYQTCYVVLFGGLV